MKYVCGFLFNEALDEVLLIQKERPEWQRGRLNGIGGKIEEFDKSNIDAMTREFKEEAGLTISDWNFCFSLIADRDIKYEVHFFYAVSDMFSNAVAQTDEILIRAKVNNLPNEVIPNLRWIIPLCLDKNVKVPVVYNIAGY
jgi:8-oxo-dGTP diphosphatase